MAVTTKIATSISGGIRIPTAGTAITRPTAATKMVIMAATATTVLKDGSRFSHRSPYPKGHPKNPMSAAEIEGKFIDCARGHLSEDAARAVIDLVDDPFRSLAGELRRAGGFAKDTTPFSEFLWADFLRRRVKRKVVESDFNRALERALELAKSDEATHLPGWCGPAPEA